MDKRLLARLTDAERLLVAETERAELAALDEDGLVALHTRIHRARGKYVGQYRRGASARVPAAGGRGKGFAQNQAARDKAEAFEIALGRVSAALAKAAKASAAQLKADRLAAAAGGTPRPRAAASTTAARAAAPARRAPATPARTSSGSKRPAPSQAKKNASSRAQGARRQAKRDAR
jgi:hypothetical protein